MDEIFEIIPNGERYKSGKIVILLLGASKLFDMLTSINQYIIAYSKHFRYNLYFLLVLAVVNVVANLTLIPQFELAGAALATLLSVVLFNIFKTYFVYAKFKIHPFQRKIGYTILISIFLICLNMVLPNLDNSWLSIVFKSIVLGGIFVSGVLIFRLSDEANMFWENFKNKLVNK